MNAPAASSPTLEAPRPGDAWLAAAFAHSPIGTALVSPEGRWLKVNPALCALLGYAEAELLARTFQELTHPDDLEANLELQRRMLAGEAPAYEVEKRCRRADGSTIAVLISVALVRDARGEPAYFIAHVQDMAARRAAAAARETAHRELVENARLAGMAEVATAVLHNVGNVLNTVNIAAETLTDNLRRAKTVTLSRTVALLRAHEADLPAFFADDPRGKQLPGFLEKLAEHFTAQQAAGLSELAQLQNSIEHIKEFVVLQQGYAKVSGAVEPVAAAALVEDALELNAQSLARHGVHVVREFAAVPPVCVEKHLVLQILTSLLRNAKHACEGMPAAAKEVTVRLFHEGAVVKISVSDLGIGIAPENLPRIFHHGFTTRKAGHGFGLHSGALAAQKLGGALRAESAGSGKGATFTLELPIASST
jgi:PAS domain S-box-containing protein